MHLRSQWMLAGAMGLAVSCAHSSPTPIAPTPVSPAPPGLSDSLKAAAGDRAKLVGAAVQASFLGDPQYSTVVDREFSYLTAEYQMKWNVIEPDSGASQFGAGDAIVDYALSHRMQVKGHALIWHGSNPSWLNGLPATEFRAAFVRHIQTVAAHYRGRVHAWDVVNEAVDDSGSSLRNTVFLQKLGDAYIADAFRLAREADPGALLFYNDYGGEGMNAKSDRIYALMRDLRAIGVPVDGVGLQMHISASNRPSDASIAANMRRLAGLGLVVHISEMDVTINNVAGSDPLRLEAQRTTYHDVTQVCTMEPRCEAITFWGVTDAHTWLAGDRPLLFDAQYQPKPAYSGVLDALRGR